MSMSLRLTLIAAVLGLAVGVFALRQKTASLEAASSAQVRP